MGKENEDYMGKENEDYSASTEENSILEHEPWTLKRIIFYILDMRIEPGLLIYMIASVMGNVIASDIQLDRACRINKEFNDTVCDALTASPKGRGYDAQETEVQKVVSGIGVWSEVVENFFPILFSIFLGSWSDIYGQKLPFVLSISGVVIRYIGLLTATFYSSWNAQIIALISLLPTSLTGGRIAISMVTYSYVTITTSIAERTVRVGIVTAVRTFGRSAGSTLSGYLKRMGYSHRFIFGIGAGFAVTALVYVIIFLKNPKMNPTKNSTCGKACCDIFNFQRIIEAAKSFFKWRECLITIQLFILVLILIFTMAPMQGEDTTLLLFVRNPKTLGWDTTDYAYYTTFRLLIAFLGGIISVLILVTWFKMSDWTLGVASCFSQIAGSIIYGFATASTEWMMYAAPVIDVLNGSMIIAARSMISKIIPKHEMGKVNAFVAVIDSTTPLWGNPVYSRIYNLTLETVPGAFFFLSAALTIPPLFLFSYLGFTKGGIDYEEQIKRKNKKSNWTTSS